MSRLARQPELSRRFEELLDRIHPLNAYKTSSHEPPSVPSVRWCRVETLIGDIERFQSVVARLLYTMECNLLLPGRGIGYDDHRYRGLGRGLLLRCYAREGGWQAAFDYARTGNNGGIAGVCKTLAARWAHEGSAEVVRARVNGFYHRLSPADRDRVVDLYLARYGHLLPPEITEDGAGRIRGAAFTRVLEAHPRLYERTR